MTDLERLKMILRESDIPFFSDDELNFYLSENKGNFNATAYQCLLVKAETTNLSLSGLSLADTASYFRRLASRYRPHNSGILSGG